MTIDSRYMEYLVKTETGYKIKEDIPKKIRKEIEKINRIYKDFYGKYLIDT